MDDRKSRRSSTSEFPRDRSSGLRPQSLSDQVYEYLRAQIVEGVLRPGAKIVELEIADRLGTSQGPVREALQRLARDGLVERSAHRATFVTQVTTDQIYEFFSIRSAVEGFAIRHTARHITSAQLKELQGLVDKMRLVGANDDLRMLVGYDMLFHRSLCEWAGSPVYLNTWLPLYAQIQRFVLQTHRQYFPNLVELANTHQPIVDALSTRNPDEAAGVITTHVMLIWSHLDPQVQSIPESD